MIIRSHVSRSAFVSSVSVAKAGLGFDVDEVEASGMFPLPRARIIASISTASCLANSWDIKSSSSTSADGFLVDVEADMDELEDGARVDGLGGGGAGFVNCSRTSSRSSRSSSGLLEDIMRVLI